MFKKTKFFAVIVVCLIVSAVGFNLLIRQQENILRRYFILNPQEKIKELNTSLANSLAKNFIREHKEASLKEVSDYIRRYGKAPLYDLFFIFQDKDGFLKQIGASGITTVSGEVLTVGNVYPAAIDNGNIDGYFLVIIRQEDSAELREGFAKYRNISYSLRLIFFSLVFALLMIIFYHDYSARMKLARDLAEIKASNDGLTGLHTHEYFMKILEIEVRKVNIYNTPMALLMLDIDYFKDFNDKYGHLAGDLVLQEVSKIVKISTRASDILARYGGEEFAAIIPYVAKAGGMPDEKRLEDFLAEIKAVAERIRRNVEESRTEFESKTLNITVSIGVAFYYKKSYNVTGASLIEKADQALYHAKRLGRNRIQISYEPSDF